MDSFLSELNKAQYEAVINTDGPNLVIAGAGSGKTRVLTYKIAHLLDKNVPASRILALTFTNKAADEMKSRIAELVGREKARYLWMGTFHSVFAKILRVEAEQLGYNSNYTIYDVEDTKSILKKIIKDRSLDKDRYKPNEVYGRISRAKNNLITPHDYIDNQELIDLDIKSRKPELCNIYLNYAKHCFKNNAMDFDDLLLNTNILFRDNKEVLSKYQDKFDYILVDEYQDTNFSQYLILKKLAEKKHNICVVGDDAQSIYSFRGAKIENIFNFKKDYPECKLYKLEKNYRSTKNILNAANSIIAKNKTQIPKKIWSDNDSGQKIKLVKAVTDTEEGFIVANAIIDHINNDNYLYSDHAILYRTNAQSRIFEESFRKKNIPYRIYGGLSFYMRKEIKDLLAYLKVIINPADDESIKRIINYPGRGIGKTTIDKLEQTAEETQTSLWHVISHINEINANLRMSTKESIHEFVRFISGLADIVDTTDAYTLAYSTAKESGILKELYNEKTPESLSKYENIQELLNSIRDFSENILEEEGKSLVTIKEYIENVALLTDQDTDDKEDKNRVHLMTIHAAKGLEFKNVFIVGLEEELFPSHLSTISISDTEEERRLFYVAITRAEENVILSYTSSRYKWGNLVHCEPSRFINEIDSEYLDMPIDYIFKYKPEDLQEDTNQEITRKTVIKSSGSVPNIHTDTEFIPDKIEKIMPGMKVMHQKFGKGKVIQLEGTLPNTKATVFFVNTGQKTLLLKYAKLKIIG